MAPLSAENFAATSLYNVSGLVALVTGGGTGIGLMIAQGLAANGAKVYISGRRKDVLDEQAGVYGEGEIVGLKMDVTSKEDIAEVKSHIQNADGRLDILVNNAGQRGPVSNFITARKDHLEAESFGNALFDSEDITQWSTHFTSNVTSIYFSSVAFLGLLARGAEVRGNGRTSSIVNITSISGIVKLAQDHFCYNSCKAAASHLTKMMATELALRKLPIRVNSIAPGVYSSEMTGNATVANREDTNSIGKPLVSIPAERAGSEAEMAATALFIASPAGGYLNGQEIVIDGGYLAVNPSTR